MKLKIILDFTEENGLELSADCKKNKQLNQ